MSKKSPEPQHGRILVVDDELSMREFLSIFLERKGYEVVCASCGEEAIQILEEELFDVVLTDLQMRALSGLDVLHTVKKKAPGTQVIMMTAYATAETAIKAMKAGAHDYLTKPFKVDAVTVQVEKAMEKAHLVRENFRLKRQVAADSSFQGIVGRSPSMVRLFEMISRVSRTKATVLVTGESGTGKELTAHAIHMCSSRSKGPFVPVNCGAIPSDLVEAELFGYVRGAFTNAYKDKQGLFQAASGGSIFLDEVGELSLSNQVALLRALQAKKVKRVGDIREESFDARIIAATNRDLQEMVRKGTFREDLFFRLNVIQLDVPPLRERRADIPLLIQSFMDKYSEEHERSFKGIQSDAMEILQNYPYPGNIRELENIIERLVTLETSDWLTRDGLPYHMMQEQSFNQLADDLEIPDEGLDLEAMVERLERGLLLKALDKSKGVRKHAADLLGINFRSMRYRLKKYKIGEKEDDE